MQTQLTQSQTATIIAYHVAVGKPIPKTVPLWDGRNLTDFNQVKGYFQTKYRQLEDRSVLLHYFLKR